MKGGKQMSYDIEVRNTMNIWNKQDFIMAGIGKKNKTLAKIKHFFKCIKWSKQRITRGYCDCDVRDMSSYIQAIIPDMLQTLKETRVGLPEHLGVNYANENEILDKMIFLWREADEGTCSQMNPYYEEYSDAIYEFTERYGSFGNKLQTEEELEENVKQEGGGTIHFMEEIPEYREISDKYHKEEERLEEYRRNCRDEAIDMLKQYFYDSWD